MDDYEIKEWQDYKKALREKMLIRTYGVEFEEDKRVFEDCLSKNSDFIESTIRSFILGDYYIAARWEIEKRLESVISLNCLMIITRKALSLEFNLPPYFISNCFLSFSPMEKEINRITSKILLDIYGKKYHNSMLKQNAERNLLNTFEFFK